MRWLQPKIEDDLAALCYVPMVRSGRYRLGWPIPGGLSQTNKDIDATEETWRSSQGYSLEREP